MTEQGTTRGEPTRAEAARGVEERLAATVHAYPGLRVIPIPAQFLRLPEPYDDPFHDPPVGDAYEEGTIRDRVRDFFAAGAGAAGQRVLRGGRMPDLGGAADEVFDTVHELWDTAGCRVDDHAGLDGRLLVVHDPAGYVIALSRHADDDPILTVGSPPSAPQVFDRGLVAGVATGLSLGCLGPCLASVFGMAAFPSLAGLRAPFWGWLPLFLLLCAVSLWRPETRRFGAGLAVSGATVGITVAAIIAT